MSQCCDKCFQDEGLREYIIQNFSLSEGDCVFCGSRNTHRIDCSKLEQMFSRVIKLCYIVHSDLPFFKYVEDFDGDYLHEKLQQDFEVFSEYLEEDTKQELLEDILENSDINLLETWFSKDDDRLHRTFESRLSFLLDALKKYGHALHFQKGKCNIPIEHDAEEEIENSFNILEEMIEIAKSPLNTNVDLWRARVGTDHSGKELAAPPPKKAGSGRANLPGQPFLYCGDSLITAVYEVGPAKNDIVSVANFQLTNKMLMCSLIETNIPFNESPFVNFDLFKRFIERNDVRYVLGKMFGKPIRPSDKAEEYLETQFITQVMREHGCQGLIYPSSQHEGGINYLFFYPFIAVQNSKSANVRVSKVKLEILNDKGKPITD